VGGCPLWIGRVEDQCHPVGQEPGDGQDDQQRRRGEGADRPVGGEPQPGGGQREGYEDECRRFQGDGGARYAGHHLRLDRGPRDG